MPPQAFRSAARLPAGSADRFISAFLWIPPPIGGPFSGQSMSPKHILLIPALALLMYLGMYSWNQRTHILDNFAANTGLEASGVVLKSVRMVQDTVMGDGTAISISWTCVRRMTSSRSRSNSSAISC